MSYQTHEASIQDSRPIYLLQMITGSLTWRYCSAPYNVTYLGFTWYKAPFTFGNISQTNELNKSGLQLVFPIDNDFASTFLGEAAPEEITTVTLYRGHEIDVAQEFIAYWKGRVLSFTSSGHDITLSCEPVFTSLRRPGLRARFQKTCRHSLYGRGCNVVAATYATSGVLNAMSGVVLRVDAAAGLPSGYLTGGMIKTADNITRYIMEHNGAYLTLLRQAKNLQPYVGDTVLLYPGCNHQLDHCGSRFSNIENYGGFPWIPQRNPLDGSSIA
jgi:uncharacterized phage protein (TIGR02218 family)